MNEYLNNLFYPRNQGPMSSADNIYGLSLPVYEDEAPMEVIDWLALDTPDVDPITETAVADPVFAATDPYSATPVRASSADMPMPSLQKAFNAFVNGNNETLTTAQKNMFQGAVLKTAAAASDMFSYLTGLAMGAPGMINKQRDIAVQNYQNQMDALDNQVLYIKHQLSDRFNKTVETNIMRMAANGLRVNAGNVLELTKESATEITEDMRTAESNARLKKIALAAGQKQAGEAARYAKQTFWTGLAQSAIKLGIAWETGGGTGESWGNLYAGYKKSKATKTDSIY